MNSRLCLASFALFLLGPCLPVTGDAAIAGTKQSPSAVRDGESQIQNLLLDTTPVVSLPAKAIVVSSRPLPKPETEVVYLSGRGKDDAVCWEFFCTAGQRSGEWSKIPVPSCWELQGFGAYGYQKDPLKEQGRYRHRFQVPASWLGKVIRIVFEGSMTDTDVWINGKSAGPIHRGAFFRFNYDITKLVNIGGENLLEATVSKYSANEGVNNAERRGDYWNFGGIFRPVTLQVLPASYIERTALDARADGTFVMEVFLGGDVSAVDCVTARIPGLAKSFRIVPTAGKAVLRTRVTGQKNWTAETPNLYQFEVTAVAKGKALHTTVGRFGFRTIEVRERDGVYVNGQRIVLKGCCRHSFWPESGRTLSDKINNEDVLLLKEMNMNAVRMSHYPPDTYFLDQCDELGLYVLDELPGWQHSYDSSELSKTFVEAMVTRDVNHPSVLFWDNGNEGGWNLALDGEFEKWDPQQRRVLHPFALSGGLFTGHYPDYAALQKHCAEGTVYMPTEFTHALYDGGGASGLEDYWEVMRKCKTCAGGFIWAFLDECVVRTDKNGVFDSCGNLAPDGIVGPHREKEGSFYGIRQIWCPVAVQEEALPALKVENRYDFTNLAQCKFEWSLAKFSIGQAGHTIGDRGVLAGPSVPPHASGTLTLNLPDGWREADVLYLTARNPEGRDLWTWSWRLNRGLKLAKAGPGSVEVQDGAAIQVRTGALNLTFSKETGCLASAGRFAFGNGPRFVASTVERVEAGLGKDQKMKYNTAMVDLSAQGKLLSLTQHMDGSNAVVEAKYDGPLSDARWTVMPGGWIQLDYEYRLDRECEIVGVQFDYPEKQVKSFRWLGRGPYRVWKNRTTGGTWDVWQNTWNDTIPAESWVFPEFKGYFADWQWAVFETSEGKITAATEQEHSYLGVYRPNEGRDPKSTKVFTPPTGLAFLDAIPAIGSKFIEPARRGPQSQPNKAPGSCKRTVYLRFD